MNAFYYLITVSLILLSTNILTAENNLVQSVEVDNSAGSKEMHYFTYNKNKKILTREVKTLDEEEWVTTQLTDYQYDENGNIVGWNVDFYQNGDITYKAMGSNTYDENGNRIYYIQKVMADSQWVNQRQDFQEYDESNQLTKHYIETWGNDQWNKARRNSYEYDDEGNITVQITETAPEGDWVNYSKEMMEYNDSGHITLYLIQEWSENAWVNAEQYSATYDENGNRLTMLKETWYNEAWENSDRYTETYDENNMITSSLRERWGTGTEQWVNYQKIIYTNENGNLITQLTQKWYYSEWLDDFRSNWTYNEDNRLLTFSSEKYHLDGWMIYPGSCDFQDDFGNGFSFDCFSFKVNWGSGTSVDEEISNLKLTAWPNPFSTEANIEYFLEKPSHVNIDIYDNMGNRTGRTIRQNQPAGKQAFTFNAGDLAPGTYYYTIHTNEKTESGKLILVK